MADKKKTTKKERLKTFAGKHKGGLIGAGVLIVCGIVYVFFDLEIDTHAVENWICGLGWFGNC